MLRAVLLASALLTPGLVQAQDGQTLGDIRQELSTLYFEVQNLRRELSTTGGPNLSLQGTSALERIDAMEAELRRLTGDTEEMENRINRVVTDGTNAVGDLEFRLCELEPDCDIGSLGETLTLGGGEGMPSAPTQADPGGGGAAFAMGEQSDFDAAMATFESGDAEAAARAFASFSETYTGGPLTAEAHYYRGQALSQAGRTTEAARAYLDSFSGRPEGDRAADALLQLGLALDTLGQGAEACATLADVPIRFPGSAQAAEASAATSRLGCG